MFSQDLQKLNTAAIGAMAQIPRNPTVSERLTARKAELENELAQINEAIQVMNAIPEVATVIDTLSRLNFRI